MSVWASTFVPLWFHFGIKNGPKSTKRVTKTTIEISIDFPIDFWTILAPFWDPFWSPLGHFGLHNGAFFSTFSPTPEKNTPKVAQCPSTAPKMTSKSDKTTSKSDPAAPNCRYPGGPKHIKNLQKDTLKRLPQRASLKLQGAAVIAVGVVDIN